MKNKIKIFRKLVRCASIALLSFSMAGCGADFLDTTPTNNISGSSIWTKATLAEQAVIGVYNVFLDQYCPNSGILDSHRIPWDAYSSVMDTDKNWIKRMPNCTGAATPSSGLFSDIYKRFYTFIYRANDVIDNIGQVPDMSTGEKQRAIAECKFLRAFAYMRLNILYKGVPLYMNAITSPENGNKARSSEADVWAAILQDLTDCVNEPNLPGKYNSGDSNYGRVTKGAAYALRGQVYMWQKNWEAAVDDFNSVADCGFGLYTKAGATSYKQLLKIANEQCEEMIFSVQCIKQYGFSNTRNITYGNRCTAGSMWNNYLPNPHFVESFETATGEKFNWDNYLPGYSTMKEKERVVFFLRDGLSAAEKERMTAYGADMSKYLDSGNEARIKKAYESRDPRLQMAVITPYAQYNGASSGIAHTYTLRWPYRGSDSAEPFDIRTDTNDKFYYLWRKFVPEGLEQTERDTYGLDIPLIRYAEVLLLKAEALNEWGSTHESEAIRCVNEVRRRAGHVELNNATYPATKVNGQSDLRERIRNEYYWEIGGEDSMYFHELRWGTWKDKKFDNNRNGLMQMWGETTYTWYWLGDQCWSWPIPAKEMEMNSNLEQNEGWIN
ncbi:RagB/SusD family nutrient uptake outer membrane protein [Bacteroides ovatus]|mgnify:FL=1|uniref:RagB/SusD family nutrient uptake outer membrane protein n=2 Tax=Bacteroides TaxID=816 RepID=A0A413EZP7_BACOV|nr:MULTISPECIES: RagB/SusD family nutrient uptake outer membrane protein [Bacteroides]RGE81160.1 RagB/SusD family nutrient uptake outer membrane protein [Bacteroides sp. AF32-8BH]RGX13525.1 RagB/SusD family nutrient uptake outer membrane protein [Bacteroides ovatus]RGX28600.1 RagB/SusD family nutrient uptake outer membrane protein [Bacteroides ovatus]